MSSKINKPIAAQSFELVRARIVEILGTELENQVVNFGNYDVDVNDVWMERWVPFNSDTEIPCINVCLGNGDYSGKSMPQQDGVYQFNIDCYHKAKTSTGTRADEAAMIKLQRLMGVCRSILDNPVYKALDFTPPFIISVRCVSVQIKDPNPPDATSAIMGRIVYEVKVSETTPLKDGVEFSGIDSQWKIALTDKGYKYTIE